MQIAFFLTKKAESSYLMETATLRQALEKMEYHHFAAMPVLNNEGYYLYTLFLDDCLWTFKHNPQMCFDDTEKVMISEIPSNRKVEAVNISAQLDELLPMGVIIASNTSALNIFEIMPERRLPDTVIAHWYAPANVIPLVEVVGNEQTYHFQVLKLVLKKLGYADWSDHITHLSYGMVELPEGKMKSREGTVVDADDLIDDMVRTARDMSAELGKLDGCSEEEAAAVSAMVGLGALKYFILKVDPKKTMLFDPRESIDFNGNTGPFIQYTHARIRSVLRKAAEAGIDFSGAAHADYLPEEIELVKMLAEYPATVKAAGDNFAPSIIAAYVYELAKTFNGYYHDHSILREENAAVRDMRLQLAQQVARVIRSGMRLLGIDVPERM